MQFPELQSAGGQVGVVMLSVCPAGLLCRYSMMVGQPYRISVTLAMPENQAVLLVPLTAVLTVGCR